MLVLAGPDRSSLYHSTNVMADVWREWYQQMSMKSVFWLASMTKKAHFRPYHQRQLWTVYLQKQMFTFYHGTPLLATTPARRKPIRRGQLFHCQVQSNLRRKGTGLLSFVRRLSLYISEIHEAICMYESFKSYGMKHEKKWNIANELLTVNSFRTLRDQRSTATTWWTTGESSVASEAGYRDVVCECRERQTKLAIIGHHLLFR